MKDISNWEYAKLDVKKASVGVIIREKYLWMERLVTISELLEAVFEMYINYSRRFNVSHTYSEIVKKKIMKFTKNNKKGNYLTIVN